jgi:hypothetical protein
MVGSYLFYPQTMAAFMQMVDAIVLILLPSAARLQEFFIF